MLLGKILSISPPKVVLLTAVCIFEVGSLLCGAAPSVTVLIFGRAVTGIGGAGIWVSVFSILAQVICSSFGCFQANEEIRLRPSNKGPFLCHLSALYTPFRQLVDL